MNQNFSNPFNPAIRIRFGLPQAGHVTLKIYNLLDAEVVMLLGDELQMKKAKRLWAKLLEASGKMI